MKNKSSDVILLFRTWLVEYCLAKGFVIHEHRSKKLSSVSYEAKQIIHTINMHD